MASAPDWLIRQGFPESLRQQAATLYFEAFAGKLGSLLGRDGRGIDLFKRILDPEFAVCAVTGDQTQLLGIAGFKTAKGSLTGGKFSDLVSVYGWFGTAWRAPALSLLEREPIDDQLLMDGIAVASQARGLGIGTTLLTAIADKAASLGMDSVRLDVIDINPRARALYERFGFVPMETESSGPLRHLFGFRSSTMMQLDVGQWLKAKSQTK